MGRFGKKVRDIERRKFRDYLMKYLLTKYGPCMGHEKKRKDWAIKPFKDLPGLFKEGPPWSILGLLLRFVT
jgi:hypothetical protein